VYAARGNRLAALEFLGEQHTRFRGTSIEARLQKNLLLLSLEGKLFPGLETEQHLYRRPPTPAQLKGNVVLFYFWAHWCSDCKRQLPILKELHARYGQRGLVMVGPTRLYGYIARGQEASPQEELEYLQNAYRQKHPIPSWMGVPVSTRNFLRFGVSTTPTLVLVDREGIVRLYSPGTLSYEELAERIEELLR
jgi:thiol-disulfide isomerase/thioredoxin